MSGYRRKSEYTPSGLKNLFENALKDNDTYEGKLVKWEECFKIDNSDINNVSFSIDLVPAVNIPIPRKHLSLQKD